MQADYSTIIKLKNRYMQANKDLETALKELPEIAEVVAFTEKQYRIAKAKETAKLRIENKPATLIRDLVNGEVADERFKWKASEGQFLACKENIKRLHKNIDTCQSILSVERAMMGIK